MEQKTSLLKDVVIRFSGDSGDGMQLTGTLFSETLALGGNVISTFPDYPAEIRAPQGTVAGVSGFQVHFGSVGVNHPGDLCDVLVAMNPAALKANVRFIKPDATIIVDADSVTADNLAKASFQTSDPISELNLEGRNIIFARITTMTREALTDVELDIKSKTKCKNMFALGICLYITERDTAHAHEYINNKFGKKNPTVAAANNSVIEAGYNYAANNHLNHSSYAVEPAGLPKGRYRTLNGNVATAWGLIAASHAAGLKLFCGSYPITPATVILEELAKHKSLGVTTVQAEDEIAGICTAIGAAFAGRLAVTTTSGPGLSLKSEALGLAVMAELPLVVVDVQRGGPSTGLPTKTEQSDLMQALYGRNGESPVVVMAATSPGDCFYSAFMAAKIAVERMVPVVLLTDGFIANSSEAWAIPQFSDMAKICPPFATADNTPFMPYRRDDQTLARKWATPAMAGLEHRVGGLEKDCATGNISYDPANHQRMVDLRKAKIDAVADIIPEQDVVGASDAQTLVIGWGGTQGHIRSAVEQLVDEGASVAHCHIKYLNPLPKNLDQIFARYKKLIVCELNSGQLATYLQGQFPQYTFLGMGKVQGQPFTIAELVEFIKTQI